jgi:hypothetical protein
MKNRAVTEGDLDHFAKVVGGACGAMAGSAGLNRNQLMGQLTYCESMLDKLNAALTQGEHVPDWFFVLHRALRDRLIQEVETLDDLDEAMIEAEMARTGPIHITPRQPYPEETAPSRESVIVDRLGCPLLTSGGATYLDYLALTEQLGSAGNGR